MSDVGLNKGVRKSVRGPMYMVGGGGCCVGGGEVVWVDVQTEKHVRNTPARHEEARHGS